MFSPTVPMAVPEYIFVDPLNSTAMIVRWEPVPNNREFMKGRVLGYQVLSCTDLKLSVTMFPQIKLVLRPMCTYTIFEFHVVEYT